MRSKVCIISVACILASWNIAAAPGGRLPLAVKDSTERAHIREYVEEIGFYQKANRDLGDPRFMFSDSKGKVDFGIGGMCKVTTFYGFGGEAPEMSFRPSAISIPNDISPWYNMSMNGTEVHLKARTDIGGHKLGAFIKISSNHKKEISLNNAYISYDNFSIGLIPSFFMDLEVGVMTTGLGFDSQIDNTHPLIGCTFRPGEKWSIATAIEWPELDLSHYEPSIGIASTYQPVPDLAAHVKYRGNWGHIQLGAVARCLTYWTYKYPVSSDADGLNAHEFGFGISFSGNYKPTSKLKLSWELSAGHGYANYLQNLGDLHLDLGINAILGSQYPTMSAIPATSDQIAAQYNFSKKFSSSLILSYSHCGKGQRMTRYDNFCESYSAIANFFWNIDEFSYLGVEYLFGTRKIYVDEGEPDFGRAHRLALVMAYCF